MNFQLHPNLAHKTALVDWDLCTVLLENERHYPWLILVPKRPNVSRLIDLEMADQILLLEELNRAQKTLWDLFNPTQLNVAAIGNKTPQLHIHVIARFDTDPAWPGTVWDHPVREAYSVEEEKERVRMFACLKSNTGAACCAPTGEANLFIQQSPTQQK